MGSQPSDPTAPAFLRKAREDLEDAQAALGAGRRNACARSSYYAAFHAAVAALHVEGIRANPAVDGTLSHKMVQAEWAGRLIHRRKLYPPELMDTLIKLLKLRVQADYRYDDVTAREARRATASCALLVGHVVARLDPSEGE